MAAVLLIARSRLRANLTATVLLVLLAGLGGGVVMASVASIRRAENAWAQLQRENPDADTAVVFLGSDGEPIEGEQAEEIEALAALPEVAVAARASAVIGVLRDRRGQNWPVAANTYLDAPHPALVGRPILVAGTMPDPAAADETAIDEQMADQVGAKVGDRVPFTSFRPDELETASDGRDTEPAGETTEMLVTGIIRQPGDLLPPRTDQYALYSDEPYLLLTPGWWEANGPDVGNYGIFVVADLEPGTAFADFEASLGRRFGERALAFSDIDEIGVPDEVRRAVDRQIGAEGRSVAAFAVAVAIAAIAVLALALARQLAGEGTDRDGLRALGTTASTLVLATLVRSLVVAVGAAALATLVAILLSVWLPVGVGRRTLRDHGIDIDLPVVAAGGVLVIASVLGLVALIAWRTGHRPAPPREPRPVVERVARAGATPSMSVGVHLALDRSPSAGAGRTAVAVVAMAIAVVVGAVAIVGSFDELRSDPSRLGQVWDASAGNFASETGLAAGLEQLDAIEGVEAVAGERSVAAQVAGEPVSAVAYEPLVGELELNIEEGRALHDEDEVVVGSRLARSLHLEVGDPLALTFPFSRGPVDLEVVGIGPVAAMGFDVDPGRSVLIHPGLASRDEEAGVSVLLVRFAGTANREAALTQLRRRFPRTVLEAPVPSRSVQTLSGLTVLPVALAVTVCLLGIAAAANGSISSVRRRRRELAMLKVLGMHRGQVRQVVRWQALAWAAVALVVGVPVGVLLGAAGWREVVRSLGLSGPLVVRPAALALVVLAVPALLIALTWWPAHRAAGTSPAVTLRSE